MKNLDNYDLWQLPAKIDPSIYSLICLLKNLQEAISSINSQSFSSSPYTVSQVTKREQYDKGAEWI